MWEIKKETKSDLNVFLTTSIQHNPGGTSLGIKARKRNKSIRIGQEEAKLSLFCR